MSERQAAGNWETQEHNPVINGRITRTTTGVTRTQANLQSPLSIRQSPRSHRKRAAAHTPATASTRRSKRARLQTSSYVEPSTDDEDDQAEAEWETTDNNPYPHQLNLFHVDQSPTPREKTYKAPKKPTPPVRLKLRTTNLASPRKAGKAESNIATTNQDVVKAFVPKWLEVPYLIWVDIFDYAADMVVNEDREKNERLRAQWLLSTSTTCQQLSEAALTALYNNPPIVSRPMAHDLTALMLKDPSTTRHNYRPKIKVLSINVAEIASKSYKGEQLDYNALVGSLSRLRFLSFWHWKDEPEWRQMNDPIRWSYPDEVFEALEKANPRLSRWIWNRRFLGSDMAEAFAQVRSVHQTKPFSSLKRLDLLNFQLPSVLHPPKTAASSEELAEASEKDRQFVEIIAGAIKLLPTLEHLSIGYSTIANTPLFNLLPKNLKSLTLLRCWEVEDNALASFLMSHGSQLQHLSLQHNPMLTLAFLTCLKSSCPKLRTLSMDFQIYSQREFGYFETEPWYDLIMAPQQVPQWPETLERLELKNARKWSAEAAEVFFGSLVDSAPGLLNLRCIDMKIRLDIPIRQRSEVRDKWVSRLEKVFLRDQNDPLPRYSLRPGVFRPEHVVLASKILPSKKLPGHRKHKPWAETESPVRMSSRILATSQEASSRASSVVRDLRTGLSRPSYAEPETDDDDEELVPDEIEVKECVEQDSEEKEQEEPLFRQGMCDKVEILIDNQKVAEVLYGMNDFLDREDGDSEDDASDEDWNGADRDDEDERLAW
ncbi:hypothetical protein QBC44DRAFT_230503 [Cladorrhinum sp. PSN332]|nr:hypothetical protein QBC44DRAFT_230503 [Cladorrhinum sp. PSN332]